MALLGLVGCGGLEAVATHEAVTDPAQLYMSLTLEARAINLATVAPYNTMQLVATPRNGRGEAISDLPAPTFRLAAPGDSAVLRVAADGVLTAVGAGNNVMVIAELVAPGPIRHADSAMVNITTDVPPVLNSLSIDPLSPQDAIWPIGSNLALAFLIPEFTPPPPLAARALDPAGQPMGNLIVEYVSLDPARAVVGQWTGVVTTLRPGPVRMVARTTAYGVTKVDTALFTTTWPRAVGVRYVADLHSAGVFYPDETRILPNGVVLWSNGIPDSVDVVFDDPTQVATAAPDLLCIVFAALCGTGNMVLRPGDGDGSSTAGGFRRFPVPGTYTYRSLRTGATGRIIVTDELPAETADGIAAP